MKGSICVGGLPAMEAMVGGGLGVVSNFVRAIAGDVWNLSEGNCITD